MDPSAIMQTTRGVVVLGATSAIARAAAIEFGRQGYAVVLAARDADEGVTVATDIRVRCNTKAEFIAFEATDYAGHASFFARCREILGEGLEGVVLGFGFLDDQKKAQKDPETARRTIDVNYTAAVSILELFAQFFEERKKGFIVGISSVAGDRGRQSNYLYGSAKAGLTAYLAGLRNRLYPAGVHVLTVKPGFVDTKMTFGMEGLFLVATPEKVGKDICKAVARNRNIIYSPWFWHYIMLIIRHVPEIVFKRLHM